MDFREGTFLLVLLLVASTNAYYKLVPDGQELVYDYNAVLHAGTHHPEKFASVFHLHSKLHLQSDGETLLVKHTDLHYKLYNGEIEDESAEELHDSKSLDIDADLENMEKPFKIVYDSTGKAKHMVTGKDEEMFIVNMKKSLASLLQIDVSMIDMDHKMPQAFHTKEMSLYGKTKTFYNVYPKGNDLIVRKTWDMDHSHHLYQYYLTNTRTKHCDAKFDDPLTHDGQKMYTIVKKDSYHVVDSVESVAGIYFVPYEGKSESFFVITNQTMELESTKPIGTKFVIDSEQIYKDFTYYMFDMMDATGPVLDVTNGHRKYDMTKMMSKVMTMLYDAVNYLDHNHMTMKTPDFEHGQLMNGIMKIIMHFDYETYDKLLNTLLQKTGEKDNKALELYYHFIPHMGTHASSKFILHLAKDKVLKDQIIVDMLETMPLFVKIPNYKYITDMAELMELDGVSTQVTKQATLAFSAMLSKAIEMHDRLYHRHGDHSDEVNSLPKEHQSDKHFPGESKYEKYITIIIKHLKDSKTDADKMTWLMCLYNTHMDVVIKHLEPLIKGDWWHSNTALVKEMTLMAMYPNMPKYWDKMYEIYWPIMTNTKLDTSVRSLAMYFIMENAKMPALLNIFWWMQQESDHDLYQFYYGYMTSWSQTTNPCKEELKHHVNKLLLYTEPPKYISTTNYWLIDYADTEFDSGMIMNYFMVRDDKHQTYKFTMDKHMWNAYLEGYTVYIHTSGMEERLFENIELKLDDPTSLMNYDKMLDIMSNVSKYKDLKVSYIVLKHDYVIMCDTIDHEHMEPLNHLLEFWFGKTYSLKKQFVHMDFEVYNKVFVPAELGIPVVLEMLKPTVYDTSVAITKDTTDKILNYHFNCNFKMWSQATFGLTFYNPFADTWQGVSRVESHDAILPIYTDMMINPAQHTMKMTWKLHKDHEKNVIGHKTYVTTVTFVDDYIHGHGHTKLKESSPKAHHDCFVSSGDEHRHNYTIVDHDSIGYHHQKSVFDTEHYMSNGTYQHYMAHIWSPRHKNFNSPLGYLITTLHKYKHLASLYPITGTMGVLHKYEPSMEMPITHVDLTLRMNKEYKKSEWILTPGMKLNAHATLAINKDDKALKTWDVNALWDINPGHTISTWKMYLTRIIPDQKDYKICWNGEKKYVDDGFTGHSTISMGHSDDGKCSTDDTIVEIKMTGQRSYAQEHHMHPYHNCEESLWTDIQHEQSFDCYYDHWSMRKYTYDVKTSHVPTEFKKHMMHMFDMYKNWHMREYTYLEDHDKKIEDNSFSIDWEYPTHEDVLDISIYTPQHGYNFTDVPMGMMHWFSYKPENLQYPRLFKMMYSMGLIDTCEVDDDSVEMMDDTELEMDMPSDWTMYFGDTEADAKKGIWMKKMDKNKLALKITYRTHTLEVTPTADEHKFDIMIDGKKLGHEEEHHMSTDWMHYTWIEDTGVVAIFCHHLGSHVIFDGEHMTIEMPHMDQEWHGKCFGHK